MTWFSVFLVNILLTGAVAFLLVRRIERRIQPTVVLEQIRTEVHALIVEFNQTTERNVALLEERILRLNRIIEQADRRVAVLRREIDTHSSETRVYNDIAQTAKQQSMQKDEPIESEPGGDPPAADRRSQILDLYEKGIASNIIAARVGTTVGEVELVVSLTQRKR